MYTLPRRLLRSSDIPAAMADGPNARPSWVLFYFGLAFLFFLSFPVLCELADDFSYKQIPATVLFHSVQRKPLAWREDHVPKVTYSYFVNGKQHTSNRVFGGFSQNSYGSEEEAQSAIKDLGTTGSCVAYVDPKNPSNSLLIRFWNQPISFIENFLLGLLLSFCLIYLGCNSQKTVSDEKL